MGTGVRHRVGDVVVREVRVIRRAVEGELKNPAPRQMELVEEGPYVRRDQPQVLGDERQSVQLSLYRAEELGARSCHPLSSLGSRCFSRYVPGGCEPSKMIQANGVHMRQQGTQAVYPPTIAGLAMDIPVIKRVAPELSRGTEGVGRHTSKKARPLPLVQQKQFRVGPHVTRIGGNKKGQVAYQTYALGMRVLLESLTLTEQQELCQANRVGEVCQ